MCVCFTFGMSVKPQKKEKKINENTNNKGGELKNQQNEKDGRKLDDNTQIEVGINNVNNKII